MIERRTLEGGMDNDSTPEFVQKGDYLVAHNGRVQMGRDGMGGAFKPLNSTSARTPGTTETTSVIGAINDDPNQRVFFFRWSTTNNHQIVCWNRRTNTTLVVLKQADIVDGLGFGQFSYITGVAMIGDYLYWCDGNTNQPRRIDVERALRANNPTYISPGGTNATPYTLPLNPWDITVARRVPMYPPKARKLVSADEPGIDDRPTSLIKDESFQFAYRYGYTSGEFSTLHCYSQIIPPNPTDYEFASGVNDAKNYDTIRVEIDKDEQIGEEVRFVEILVRIGNNGSWNIIKSFDREVDELLFDAHNSYGDNALGMYFYNENIGIPLSDSESYVNFYDVPIFSNALEVADNRLFLFNNVKGYDHVVDSGITLRQFDLGRPTPGEWRIIANYYLIEWHCGTGVQEVVVMHIDDSYGPISGWYETPYTSAQFNSSSLSLAPVGPFVRYPIIDHDIPPTELIQHINSTCLDWTVTEYAPGFAVLSDIDQFVNVARSFREGASYRVQKVFFDFAGRTPGICHSVATFTIPKQQFEKDTYTMRVDWEVDNQPFQIPIWADSYAIARSRVVEPFVAGPARVRYGEKQSDGTYNFVLVYSDDVEVIAVDWSYIIGSGIGYTFSDGDIMHIIDQNEINYYLGVVGTQGNYIICERRNIGTITSTQRFYAEIRSPRVEPSDTYWEIGHSYKIINPGTPTREFSQVSGSIFGDTYFALRRIAGSDILVQAMNPNNNRWSHWPQDYGRPTKLLFSKQQRYETDIHPSGPFFPGTETNQLNAFLSGENKQLDLAIGFGQRLVLASRTQEYGTVMLAIGKAEVASIYLGRTEFFNADETPNVLRSTNVIGNVNILKGGFGTLNPESCFKNDGNVYWFSAIKSSFVRYAKDGVNPISDKKMSTFAAWLGNLVLTTASDTPGQPGVKVAGGFDDFHKEALWAIPPIGNWPIAFNVLDAVAEELAITELTPGDITAPIVSGEIYRFSMAFSAPVLVNITVWDYHFGQKTFTTTSANPSFMFVGRPGAPTTITVTTTPALNTVLYGRKLERMRQYPYSAIDRVPKTIAFNENSGRWSHTSSHTPEWFSKVGDQLITFRGGVLYMHDATSVGTFYGVQYPAWISLAFNEQPNMVKRLQGVSLESNTKPAYIHIRTEEPFVQSSDLVASDIETEEGIFSSSILRDRLSPNTSGTVNDKLYRGDEMRGRYAKVLLEWTKATTFAARIFNLISRVSGGNKT